MRAKKYIAIAACLSLCSSVLFAGTTTRQHDNTTTRDGGGIAFSVDHLQADESEPEKHYLAAAGGVLLQNILLYSWNYFLVGAGWTQVTLDQWLHFYERKLEFDGDWFWTNFVLHPYQGSLYYMTSRSCNLNQFESVLFAVLGSSIWEWFCETNAPSTNDMVYTTIGAWPLGEMLHRLSFELEAVHPFLRFMGNPMRLYTEPVTRGKPRGSTGNVRSFSLKTGFGLEYGSTRAAGYETLDEFYPFLGKIGFDVLYNDPFAHETKRPFDQFRLKMEMSMGPGNGTGYKELEEKIAYDITLLSDAMLYSWDISKGRAGHIDAVAGFSMNYDFIWNSFFVLSSLAPGVSYKQRTSFRDSSLLWQNNLGLVLLGTTDFYYFRRKLVAPDGAHRSYNYNVGFELHERLAWEHSKGHLLDLSLHCFGAYAFDDKDSDVHTGWEFYGLAQLSYDFPLARKLRLGVEYNLYAKYSLYDDLPDAFALMHGANLYVKWLLK